MLIIRLPFMYYSCRIEPGEKTVAVQKRARVHFCELDVGKLSAVLHGMYARLHAWLRTLGVSTHIACMQVVHKHNNIT